MFKYSCGNYISFFYHSITQHTHTHTHTRGRFHVLWGHSTGVMFFILYKTVISIALHPKSTPYKTLGEFLDRLNLFL